MPIELISLWGTSIIVLGCYVLWIILSKRSNTLPLPPGPKGLPIVGNIRDLPPPGVREWEHWLKHKDLYGPISSINLLGMTLVFINDRECAMELLDKNSIKTMSRPKPIMAADFAGFDKSISVVDLKTYRRYRRAISKVIGSRAAVSKFNQMQDLEASRFLWRVLKSPRDFVTHLQTEAGAFILKITYGYNVASDAEDPLVAASENVVEVFAQCARPENWLVNVIPSMRYIPEWFPGGGFKKKGREIAEGLSHFIAKPLAFTKYQKAQNSHDPSYASDLIDQGEDKDVIEWTASAMYMAGADTTAATIKGALLALLFYPEVQRAAQAEIDRVIGPDRLPVLADRDNLPYIEALMMEAHRWHTVAPMALPHIADEDIIYKGYLIPKGAALMANSWFFNHDPNTHRNPEKFSPERFLATDGHEPESDPREISFGYGRRICPGKFVADTAIFVTLAQILSAYNITKAIGEDGREIEPIVNPKPGIVSLLDDFPCTFTPRSPKYVDLIRRVEKEHPFKLGDPEILQAAYSAGGKGALVIFNVIA